MYNSQPFSLENAYGNLASFLYIVKLEPYIASDVRWRIETKGQRCCYNTVLANDLLGETP
jgi:hypothetical protein